MGGFLYEIARIFYGMGYRLLRRYRCRGPILSQRADSVFQYPFPNGDFHGLIVLIRGHDDF